ncbi:MAG: sugar phosphate isomerase/epimerase family protein [Candidatus Brocadiia bacterium]
MKLSVYTLACPEYSFEEAADKLEELDIKGVEWRVSDVPDEIAFDPQDGGRFWGSNRATIPRDSVVEKASEIANITEQHGLSASSLAGSPDPTDRDDLKRQMEAANILGASAIRVGIGGSEIEDFEEALAATQSQWDDVEQIAAEMGVKAIAETHHGGLIPSASAARRFVEGKDPEHVGILWDPGNMVWEGYERPEYGLSMIQPWLAHIHVKNARPVVLGTNDLGQANWGYEWCPLKEGLLDWCEIMAILKQLGYDGYVSLEDFNPETQAEEKLNDFAQYFAQIMETL